MATITQKLIEKQNGGHAVGYFTSIFKPEKLEGGAKCKADVDNTELVQVYFEDTDQEVVYVKRLTAATDKADAIVLSPEVLHFDFENKTYFFNAKDEMATVYPLTPQAVGKTFKTSDFKAATSKDLKNVKRGWYAYFDPTQVDGKYLLTDETPSALEATAKNVFKVFNVHFEDEYELLGLDMVELEIL